MFKATSCRVAEEVHRREKNYCTGSSSRPSSHALSFLHLALSLSPSRFSSFRERTTRECRLVSQRGVTYPRSNPCVSFFFSWASEDEDDGDEENDVSFSSLSSSSSSVWRRPLLRGTQDDGLRERRTGPPTSHSL